MIWNEGVSAADFETEHFRRALADRLGWAVADADSAAPPVSPLTAISSPGDGEHTLAGAL